MRTTAQLALLALLALSSAAITSMAQAPVEVEIDQSAAKDLYISRRPPVPDAPKIPPELQALLETKEKQADAKRSQAIGLLRTFLESKPVGDSRAEGLFKLAELLWEDARRVYIAQTDRYEREVEKCRQLPAACPSPPKEPELDFSQPEKHYKTILSEHPSYARIDLVLYLVGFAAREDGRVEESLDYFRRVIEAHRASPLYYDSWMMVGEFYFQATQWEKARDAYAEVLGDRQAQSYDLALFKTAWCDWKLGDADSAARKFKLVLDLAEEAQRSGNARERKRREQLRDEALDYLVLVFTEDESVTAKDVFEFLASIGGDRYSAAVLKRLAETYYTQGRWERSVEAYRFLIGLGPNRFAAAKYQREIVNAYLEALEGDKAMAEIKILVDVYSPTSKWAKSNRRKKDAVSRHVAATERLVRDLGRRFHFDAQEFEKQRGRPDAKLFARAASTYAYYLSAFEDADAAGEVRYLRADILFFKLGKTEEAGDEYLRVGKTEPVKEFHKDALTKAMAAFKQLRPKNVGKGRKLSAVDKKFAAATDLYATLFPADKEIVGVIFENGQLFYDYGDYDEAVKRFGLIITKYPDDKNAGAAGDRILDSLSKGQDYENIEEWARKLKKAKAFRSKSEQARLDRLIVESISKSGEKYASDGKYEKAAAFYLRVPDEFPKHSLAPRSLFNAAVMWEKAKKPEKAATTYLSIADKYPSSDLSKTSAFTAAKVLESVAYFDRAASAYETVAKRYPKENAGADALFNAGVLRQALGQPKRAIVHYETYAKRYRRSKKDAEEVAFRVGVVHEEANQASRAAKAFDNYLASYGRGRFALEASTRSGRAQFSLGKTKRARAKFTAALKRHRKLSGESKKAGAPHAAEAKYHLGELVYRAYDRIKLDVKPKKLAKLLDKKMKLLGQARELYAEVVDFGDPQWATAALYRIGAVYEEFAVTVRDAPLPAGLNDAEKEQYRNELDNYVIDIEERAIEQYRSSYETALGLKVYNRFTKKIRDALGRMSPSSYPPENESRSGQRIGDRVPEPKLVIEVVRDDN